MNLEDRFAYEKFRPGQMELANKVYNACMRGEVLLTEAMSGFGKTSATLAGVLTAAEEMDCRVVYTCRTKRQINRIMEEISRLQTRHSFKAASLQSKFDYCLLKRQRAIPRESFGWYCTFNVTNNLCSYFLNVTLAGEEFERMVSRAVLKVQPHSDLIKEAEMAHVCPYEVARLSINQARVAAVPYHYVFDPRTSPILIDRNDLERKKIILVVDEAHNLRDFLRETRSAAISMGEVEGAIREANLMLMDEAAKALGAFSDCLENTMKRAKGWLLDKDLVLGRLREDHGMVWLQNLAFELTASAGAAWGSLMYERRLPSLILRVGNFITKLSSSEGSVLVQGGGVLGLVDPNPISGLANYLNDFRAAVLMSATMNPSSVFARSIGLGTSLVQTYEVPSAPTLTVRTIIDTGTSTRYKLRTPEMFSKIAHKVSAIIEGTKSGVGVFLPSYAILKVVSELVSKRVSTRHAVYEAPGLSSQEASDIFDSFRSEQDSIMFAVQGGRFSEGEDFAGESMGSVVVVGLSLPPPSPIVFAEYAYLKRMGEQDSYLMLSRLPAVRKAFQAAGRHIRSPGKKGLVFLLDGRFNSTPVMDLMPSWLRRDLVVGDFTPVMLSVLAQKFWTNQG